MSNAPAHPKIEDDEEDGVGLDKKLQSQSVQCIDRLLRICNFLNACLLFIAAILALIDKSLNVPLALTAIYVMIFALCLITFELRWKAFERIIFRNFGFMFGWWGRVIFFAFIGTLCIGFDTVLGYVAAAVTGVNLIWNIYCYKIHAEYAKWVRDDNAMRRARASQRATKEAAKAVESNTKKAATNYTPETAFPEIKVSGGNVVAPPPGRPADVPVIITTNNGRDEWEKLYDEGTKQYYYHNHATGETRWDLPQ